MRTMRGRVLVVFYNWHGRAQRVDASVLAQSWPNRGTTLWFLYQRLHIALSARARIVRLRVDGQLAMVRAGGMYANAWVPGASWAQSWPNSQVFSLKMEIRNRRARALCACASVPFCKEKFCFLYLFSQPIYMNILPI